VWASKNGKVCFSCFKKLKGAPGKGFAFFGGSKAFYRLLKSGIKLPVWFYTLPPKGGGVAQIFHAKTQRTIAVI
jgi:hypothetical protein